LVVEHVLNHVLRTLCGPAKLVRLTCELHSPLLLEPHTEILEPSVALDPRLLVLLPLLRDRVHQRLAGDLGEVDKVPFLLLHHSLPDVSRASGLQLAVVLLREATEGAEVFRKADSRLVSLAPGLLERPHRG